MSFITEWIGSKMKDPAERDREWNAMVTQEAKNATRLKTTWSLPRFGPGYWKSPKMSGGFEHDKRFKPVVNKAELALKQYEEAQRVQQATFRA